MTGTSTPAIDIGGRRSERLDSDHTSEDMSYIQSPGMISASFVDVGDASNTLGATATVHENGYHFGSSMEPVTEENELQKSNESEVPLLPGETYFFINGKDCTVPLSGGGYICITNYRIISSSGAEDGREPQYLTFPLNGVEQFDLKPNIVELSMKCGMKHIYGFCSDSDAQKFHKLMAACFHRLNRSYSALYGQTYKTAGDATPLIPDDFSVFAWKFSEAVDAELPVWLKPANSIANEITHEDFKRLEMDDSFKISSVNTDYSVCPTYPEKVIVPKGISDQDIQKGAPYRSIGRFPAVVWRCKKTRAVLLRSSQPQVGILSWRNELDEKIIEEAVKAGRIEGEDPKQFIIMDARGYTSAFANRARSGGFENSEYYQQAKMEFLGLPNIHSVRSSFSNIRNLLHNPSPPNQLLQSLQSTMWLNNMSNLLTAGLSCAEYLQKGHSVLVHCSDGWDRTTQVTALAKIMLDDFYRTIDGFEYLIRRDWVAFGHKLHDRQCVQINWNDSERCPVFLQFLEAVRHLQREQPTAFEFTHAYLIKLAKHAYSGLFGTFLFNSHKERKEAMEKRNGTLVEIWRYIGKHNEEFVNQTYDNSYKGPLKPINLTVLNLRVWHEVFVDEGRDYTYQMIYAKEDAPRPSSGCATPMATSTSGTLIKSKSSESINSLNVDEKPKESSAGTSPTEAANNSFMTSSFHHASFNQPRLGLASIDTDGMTKFQDDEQETLRKKNRARDRELRERDQRILELKMAQERLDHGRKGRLNSLCDLESDLDTGLERAMSDLSMVDPENELPNFRPNTTWETKATNCAVCHRHVASLSMYTESPHHCRNCGKVVCELCSTQRYAVVEEGASVFKRVCDTCYASMQEPKITSGSVQAQQVREPEQITYNGIVFSTSDIESEGEARSLDVFHPLDDKFTELAPLVTSTPNATSKSPNFPATRRVPLRSVNTPSPFHSPLKVEEGNENRENDGVFEMDDLSGR